MRRRLRKKQARNWARKEREFLYATGKDSLFFGDGKYIDEFTLWIETSQMKTFIENARGCSLHGAISKYTEKKKNIRNQRVNMFFRGTHGVPYVSRDERE